MIVVNVNKNTTELDEHETLTSGSINANVCHFNFSDDWAGLTRTATFRAGDVYVSVILDDSNECNIPWEVLVSDGVELYVGVVGVAGADTETTDDDVVLPTVWELLGTIRKGATRSDDPVPPTPDVYNQLVVEISKKQDKLIPGKNITIDDDGTINADTSTEYDAIVSDIDAINTNIDNINSTLSDNADDIANNTADIADNAKSIATNTADIAKNAEAIEANTAKIDGISDTVTQQSESITLNTQAIEANTAAIADNTDAIKANTEAISNKQDKLIPGKNITIDDDGTINAETGDVLPDGELGNILLHNGKDWESAGAGNIAPNGRIGDILTRSGSDNVEWLQPEDAIPDVYTDIATLKNQFDGGAVGQVWTKTDDGEAWQDNVSADTPYIGENGDWYVGDTDTGVQAKQDHRANRDLRVIQATKATQAKQDRRDHRASRDRKVTRVKQVQTV
jgi:hypothetical protein